MHFITHISSPVGPLTLASDGTALTGLWLDGQKHDRDTLPNGAEVRDELPVFRDAAAWLADYFIGKRPAPDALPLAPAGSAFRQAVWRVLLTIPYGKTLTYGAIARQLAGEWGRPVSAQAVGGAVGHNPISIIIPCHRVIGADGSLTGYAAGLDKKIHLLEHEGIVIPRKP